MKRGYLTTLAIAAIKSLHKVGVTKKEQPAGRNIYYSIDLILHSSKATMK